MSALNQKELLIYGYLRQFFKSQGVELPPEDLIRLFALWVILIDTFDKECCDKGITFQSDTCISKIDESGKGYSCAVGTAVVGKGEKQSWICRIDKNFASVIVGIVDDETVNSNGNIEDHTDDGNNGYGIGLNTFKKYHNYEEEEYDSDSWGEDNSPNTFYYARQFHKDDGFVMTITLDMTQQKSDHGILNYEFHMEPKDIIKTDGRYTTIAWDDVDIDNKYRVAFSIYGQGHHQTIKFLSDIP